MIGSFLVVCCEIATKQQSVSRRFGLLTFVNVGLHTYLNDQLIFVVFIPSFVGADKT